MSAAGAYRPRVRGVCAGCRQTFELQRAGESYCAGCRNGSLDAEADVAWRAFLAGYSVGWHLAILGAADAAFKAELAACDPERVARFAAGLALGRAKAAAYLMAGLP